MMHMFIENYFKNQIDSIKEYHNRINKQKEVKEVNDVNDVNNIYTIYFDNNDYYAISNNDISSAKHISLFSVNELLDMRLRYNVDREKLEEYILSMNKN